MWKHIAELTIPDLQARPVWEWSGSEADARVRPSSLREIPDYAAGAIYIALTSFLLAGGKQLFGYCSPADPSGLDYTRPVIITSKGTVPLWHDSPPGSQLVSKYLAWLECQAADVFPILVESQVPVGGDHYREYVHAI
jgi:hypothetical protein